MFETIRKKSKRNYYSESFANYKDDIKNNWKIICHWQHEKETEESLRKNSYNNTTVVEKQEVVEYLGK